MLQILQIVRVLRGQGDQWDNRARSRGVTASFSLNGIGLVPEETPDLYQENEELKVRFQPYFPITFTISFQFPITWMLFNYSLHPKIFPGCSNIIFL